MIYRSLLIHAIRLGGLLSMSAVTLTAGTAHAQDHVVVGGGVAATPNYQGSEDYRILPLPAVDIKEGWLFANLRNGIGIEPIDTDLITIGASAVFVQGIRGKDLPQGIDKVSDAVGARIFTSLRANGFVASFGATKVLGGTRGLIADATVSYPVRLSSRATLTPTIGTTWADRKYNNRYFGVTARESAASGLPQFATGSGFKDVSGSLTASYRLTNRITLSVTGGVTSLLGKVKASPIVEKVTQPVGILTFTYRL
jgi:outer membrane protein